MSTKSQTHFQHTHPNSFPQELSSQLYPIIPSPEGVPYGADCFVATGLMIDIFVSQQQQQQQRGRGRGRAG